MRLSMTDDAVLRRQISAMQFGVFFALLLTVVGGQHGMSTAISTQLPLLAASVGVMLVIERLRRRAALPEGRPSTMAEP